MELLFVGKIHKYKCQYSLVTYKQQKIKKCTSKMMRTHLFYKKLIVRLATRCAYKKPIKQPVTKNYQVFKMSKPNYQISFWYRSNCQVRS